MGLDMYLFADKYVGGWDHGKDAEYDDLARVVGIEPFEDCPAFTVRATVGYWRKANAVHGWFVRNVQKGKDECHDAIVSREQLAKLRDDCHTVLEAEIDGSRALREVGSGVLPTRDGFFFGSTEYDDLYVAKLRQTVKIVDRVLSDKSLEGCEFYYRASW